MEGTYVTGSVEETKDLAKEFAKELKEGITLCLNGELATGKTTFTQGLGEYFGLDRMTSPTYVIVHQYPINPPESLIKTFYHVDLYRLKNYWEIRAFSLDELWSEKSNLIVVEWPERLETYLPKSRYEINFKTLGADSREVTLKLI
ncbi:tRNA (adenosine(37)-N6)-threonylcarbamoyltransferase complex ATPase subunit type 1 TsaE [Candidatus Collierbacteria bacterium RIFCSPLOWO2_01_FULL_50_23]|uniref:tRNA threonylcarbamoyladenosine biosynthesis protein TsaE n=2 Tax=Candidatus Collieribacteriota TaxID=1752725 RepID=A0A1F5ETE6_9BACT|nr:MAG: tRNA (adenosine(37)-N6)-threonylcarbamoyltransferase complex ATPase subunit type 1 TsaE [Candidatus Collierbacteria bacterium RIFCSPHIGHO2_02_FULL_49_10]OGD71975.1 MAG: tRNA (adenosine(37)-N6)-threonylcarbamoyltransferase complex ATPase subunit type 1 TsaE [Candidatus Collierbacteria bacterium RIFCSPHIGHO2_01_FULL_50_25]OGD74894.1 MAG: tRNA (adenosine(37)-N6)-threonylcarbamoyltransferase complex ATPase subunit type 1 TsaE [Candidatus Collierbacteria bacterium RIFCSPLOWO2_01_FULL_50_23]